MGCMILRGMREVFCSKINFRKQAQRVSFSRMQFLDILSCKNVWTRPPNSQKNSRPMTSNYIGLMLNNYKTLQILVTSG